MTKALTKAEKKERKEIRKQQKAKSKTVKTFAIPKHEDPPAEPVNLCDDCAYECGECEGKPKFAIDADPTLTGAPADAVVECEGFLNVAKMPTADQANKGPFIEEDFPDRVIVCSGGCGKTTEGVDLESKSGEFKEIDESDVPEWTCQECLDKAGESEEEPKPEPQVIRTDLPERPDPKRFQVEEDLGTCPSCETPLKRTAFNRYQDAVRCTNGRCRAYRTIVKTISSGVK